MSIDNCIESLGGHSAPVAGARAKKACGIVNFVDNAQKLDNASLSNKRHGLSGKKEYGDWQTNMELALNVCRMLKKQGWRPQVLVEPTCGKGNFILAALQTFDSIEVVYGVEINGAYLEVLKNRLSEYYAEYPERPKANINLYHSSIFDFDLSLIKREINGREILVVGNPPWVTNSSMGRIQSENLPVKSNFKNVKGVSALTGKGNFDIAEYICIQMIKLLSGENARLALLVKNSVIKNIIYEQRRVGFPADKITQYNIDADKEFGASVSASLLSVDFGNEITKKCEVRNFYTAKQICEYGWVDDCFVSDTEAYMTNRQIDGTCQLEWWSGLKHDCSKVMELTPADGKLVNGFGRIVDVEPDLVYPLVKSSDIKQDKIENTRKYVIVPQKSVSDDTSRLAYTHPKAYDYLTEYSYLLDNRGSSIYKKRPRFCLFGIGDYSFSKYKVVVSGLYKHMQFSLVGFVGGKPVMLDDTCYLLGFDDYAIAHSVLRLLNSAPVQEFIHSLCFADAKRVINKEILMRIDLQKALEHVPLDSIGINLAERDRLVSYLKAREVPRQAMLF